ncbi:flagellar brake protein [Chengkuizengella axinellae]|uniref:PilZ domain-containing protein n=1 Tax=Chengkuizengella axinellae TaxID=3064388 RepID=A0ABT9IWM8_9BACL|nr:PilZ domain-containing protein [Chengkuizengella sp. 2205SS18-9]MDP5273776.1 PilZ domain-containing protein [Chengkuizengella sp. 2205SS18-9]
MLKIGHILLLEIQPNDELENNDTILYKTRISDIQNNMIFIEMPTEIKSGKFRHLQDGVELFVRFNSEDDVKYGFSSFVIGTKKEGIRQILIKKPSPDEFIHIDDRKYLRVPANLELALQSSNHHRFLAKTVDISGGGIAFICEEQVEVNQSFRCWLLIQHKNEHIQHIPFEGKVLRMKKLDSDRTKVMLHFMKIDEEDRRSIIRYCFERQLELRKK